MNKGVLKSAGIVAVSAAVLFTGCGKINGDATLVTINNAEGVKDTISLGYGNFAAATALSRLARRAFASSLVFMIKKYENMTMENGKFVHFLLYGNGNSCDCF